MAFKTFVQGDDLDASELNTYLMKQSVMVFANEAARTAAIPSPIEGMTSYLEDVNRVETFLGTFWRFIGGDTPRFQGIRAGTVGTTTGNKTTLTFDGVGEVGGFTQSAGIVTLPLTGSYLITGQINWVSGAALTRDIILSFSSDSGATWVELAMNRYQLTSTAAYYTNVSYNASLLGGTQVRLQGFQSSGGNLNMTGAVIPCSLNITFLGV